MVNSIINTAIKVLQNSLQLQWGMTIENKRLNWEHKKLELRLYCDPSLHLTDCRPATQLFPTEKSSGMEASVIPFPFAAFSGSKSETRNRFFAGPMVQDADGLSYYPVRLDVSDLDLPEEGTIYPSIIWSPVNDEWLDSEFRLWVVMGRTAGRRFEVMYRPEPYTHSPEKSEDTPAVLPDVMVVPHNERVQNRSARPRLFISYAHADIALVNAIAHRLSNEFYYDVWIDYDSIRAGRNWHEELSAGIQEASAFLFMMTPESLKSEWCIAELNHAKKHGRLIIPLRLNGGIETADTAKVPALRNIHYHDFVVEDAEPVWQRLITQLHEAGITVPARQIQLLKDPHLRRLHEEYLRHLFNDFSAVDLSYLLDARPDRPISLLDVYVRLRLGVSFNIEVENGQYVDWWLREVAKPVEKPDDETARENQKPKSVNGFSPDADTVIAWEMELRAGWDRRVTLHQQEQEEKPEVEREELSDGTWYWNRIESETGPALMKYLVITGDPGSGKSTLLRHMALAMAGQQLEDGRASLDNLDFWPHPAYTPLFIPLRALIRSTFPNATDGVTLEKIFSYIRDHILKPFGALDYESFLRSQMNDGDVIFMLDGLDEVPQAEDRREQVQAIVKQLRTYDRCRIIVTSRPYAYYARDWQLSGFGHVDLVTLEKDRLDELARRLFQAVLGDGRKVDAQIDSFNRQMERVPDELKASPLLFTLLASIWLTDTNIPEAERLPDSHGRIYRKCVESLIARWTHKDAEGLSTADLIGLNETDLRRVLELLAYRVHSQQRTTDDAQFQGGEIMNTVQQLKIKDVNPVELIDALAQRSGIIVGKYENVYQYAHRSFQEHLSACHLSHKERFPTQLVADVLQSPIQWRNVLELIPDEVDTPRLWDFIKKQLPTASHPLPVDAADANWWVIYYACRWIRDHALLKHEEDDEIRDIIKRRFVQALERMLETGALDVKERAEMGRLLAATGDTRPGVMLRDDGLPGIAWSDAIPAGTFIMGSDKSKDKLASDNETPQRDDVFVETFYMARYPVTNAQYKAFMDAGGYAERTYWTDAGWQLKEKEGWTEPEYWNDPEHNLPNHPVVGVSWYEAYAFTQWLDAALKERPDSSMAIRLPREQEWEKAARGTDGRIYPYGDEFDANKGNTSETGIGMSSAVGMFPDDNLPYGLRDMSGNVWEWCLTKWRGDYTEITEDNHPDGDAGRVLRGGSFICFSSGARCAARGGDYCPDVRDFSFGFRVCAAPILE